MRFRGIAWGAGGETWVVGFSRGRGAVATIPPKGTHMPTLSGPLPPHVQLPDDVAVERLDASRIKTGGSLYEMGEELTRVYRQKSYRKYADTWAEFLHKRKLPGRTTCAKLMAVIADCPRET